MRRDIVNISFVLVTIDSKNTLIMYEKCLIVRKDVQIEGDEMKLC